MKNNLKGFPWRNACIGLVSIPFWYFVLVSQGVPPERAVIAGAAAAAILLLVLLAVWKRANRAGPRL
jgi:hypothetical protein